VLYVVGQKPRMRQKRSEDIRTDYKAVVSHLGFGSAIAQDATAASRFCRMRGFVAGKHALNLYRVYTTKLAK